MQVMLYKRHGSYVGKDGTERDIVNLYIGLDGNDLIPIDPVYYRNKNGDPDTSYSSRKRALSMLATELPPKEVKPVAAVSQGSPVAVASEVSSVVHSEEIPDF